jgi:DNA-binding Lrp family transcriptional regulator
LDEFDDRDRKLLNLLQVNNQRRIEDLAAEVALSPSAVQRRLKGYRNSGIIAADVSVLSAKATGPRLMALVHVQLERHEPAAYEPFKRSLVQATEVQFLLEISGSFDLMLLVNVPHMDGFNAFVDQLASGPMIRRYETSFVKRAPKLTLAIPMRNLEGAPLRLRLKCASRTAARPLLAQGRIRTSLRVGVTPPSPPPPRTPVPPPSARPR